MTNDTNKQIGSEKIPSTRPYHPPRLLVYGALRDLTASGSEPNTEDMIGGTPMSMP